MVIADYLRDCGYKVVEGVNAAEALAVLEAGKKIDVVLAEIRLAGSLDGFEATTATSATASAASFCHSRDCFFVTPRSASWIPWRELNFPLPPGSRSPRSAIFLTTSTQLGLTSWKEDDYPSQAFSAAGLSSQPACRSIGHRAQICMTNPYLHDQSLSLTHCPAGLTGGAFLCRC
jgi:CheY-like chemotaxis protein